MRKYTKKTKKTVNLLEIDAYYIENALKALTLGGITLEYSENLTFLQTNVRRFFSFYLKMYFVTKMQFCFVSR